MARIDSYVTATPPVAGGDMLIGTDVTDNNATKNFTVSQLASFINSGSGFVPYTGATQNLDLGSNNIYAASAYIRQLTTTARLNATSTIYLNANPGASGQVLTSQGLGLPAIWSVAASGPQGIQGPVGPQGPIGPVGPAGLTWIGTWTSGTSYILNDAVGYSGASWFCILATSGTTTPDLDTTHWALLASQGAQGPIGPAGAQGPTGATGATGASGNNTLQQVLDLDHSLINNVNKQGTNAGVSNTGLSVNAFGNSAAASNTADNVNAFGLNAGFLNTGIHLNAIGYQSGSSNSGQYVNAFGYNSSLNNTADNVNAFGNASALGNSGNNLNALGYQAGKNNTAIHVNAIGSNAAFGNTGTSVNAIGSSSASSNSGNNVNAFGESAGNSNTYSHVNLFGNSASASANSQTVFSNAVHNARIGFGGITADRLYTLPDASGTFALTTQIPSIQTVKVTLTNADLNNAFTSPFEVIATPGAGKFIHVLSVCSNFTFGSSGMSVASPYLFLNYDTGLSAFSGNAVSSTSSVFVPNWQPTTTTQLPVFFINHRMVIVNSGSSFTGGVGNSIDIYITYETITL